MAKYVAINKASVQHVDFLVNGELVAPTSATLTITNNTGAIIGSWDEAPLTLPADATGVNIAISASDNQVTLANEVRYLDVEFVYEGITYSTQDFYILRTNIKFPLSSSDILTVLGMSDGDIPSDQIDILSAFMEVQADVGQEVDLSAILASGSALLPALINAVKYKAASYISIGAQNSLMQMEQADNTLYRRFEKIEWGTIDDKISKLYAAALFLLMGSTESEGYALSGIYTGVDPVTGE